MRPLLALLAVAALLLPGCSQRERANPFDPLNPGTGGRPAGFQALAGHREVSLRWLLARGNTLTGYRLFRSGPTDSTFVPITDVLPSTVTSYRDFPLTNGRDYSYRLYFVFVSGLGNLPAEDVAAPGAALPWLVEDFGTDLIRTTPDNRRVALRRGGHGGLVDVATNPVTGEVWVADEGMGRAVVYHPITGVTTSIPGFILPRAVAVDAFDGTGWVCDQGRQIVYHFRRDGSSASTPIERLDRPVDVAVDPQDGSVWVCELGADRVARYDLAQRLWTQTVTAPSRVAVDSTTREGWVTSFTGGTVTRISPAGQTLAVLSGFRSPLGVAVDHRRGRIWIADPGASQVIALARDGQEEFRVAGLADAGELSVDVGTGEAWAVLGLTGILTRISPDGTVIRSQSGFQRPIAVSVDPGGR